MKTPTSIARLGDAMQMAYVPANLEATLHFWTKTIGAGPFFAINHVKLDRSRYRGEPTEIDFSIMLGYWGDMQIELARPPNNAPSFFKPCPTNAHEPLHHFYLLLTN